MFIGWQNKKSGFTLIELLVVISIISLLSTVVMASLNSARTKAQEAAIKQDLHSIKTQAELEHSKIGDYSTVPSAIAPMIEHINKNGGTATTTYSTIVGEGYKRYGVSAKLNSDPNKNWSVSSEGSAAVWDTADTGSNMTWITAQDACKISGKRLPTIEELKALWDAHGTTPSNMKQNLPYWSSTIYSSNNNDYRAWIVYMRDGSVTQVHWPSSYFYVRCVR